MCSGVRWTYIVEQSTSSGCTMPQLLPHFSKRKPVRELMYSECEQSGALAASALDCQNIICVLHHQIGILQKKVMCPHEQIMHWKKKKKKKSPPLHMGIILLKFYFLSQIFLNYPKIYDKLKNAFPERTVFFLTSHAMRE